MKLIITLALLLLLLQATEAQYNTTTFGVRVGQGDGTTMEASFNSPLKRNSNKRISITSGVTFGNTWNAIDNYGLTSLYEIVDYIDAGWQWHYGIGLSVGYTIYKGPNIIEDKVFTGDNFANFGLTPVIGLEKHYRKSPFNISIEIRPNIPLINIDYSLWGTIGFAFHYRFD